VPRTALVRLAAFASLFAVSALASAAEVVLLGADADDDDTNGVPDREQAEVRAAPDLRPLARGGPGRLASIAGDPIVRVLVDGRPLAVGADVPPSARRIELQATGPGRAQVSIFGRTLDVRAVDVLAIDGAGRVVDPARSHASLERTPPDRAPTAPLGPGADPDALRVVIRGLPDDLPGTITVTSLAPDGAPLDGLDDIALLAVPCPEGTSERFRCGSTPPLRAVADDIDRSHPAAIGRSLRAELGGALVVSADGHALQSLRVAGPRSSPLGPIERYRATLRVLLVRATARGAPPMGGDDRGALEVARAEVARANALWGACGVSFGPPASLDVRVVDPPATSLVAIGCDLGLPASGGALRLRVDGKRVAVDVPRGARPLAAAQALATALARAGFSPRVSANAPIGVAPYGTADVQVFRPGGAPAQVELPDGDPISTDATLTACLGRVDLSDGLQHFGDVDAIAGTVEERALIKAFDDGDPSTIDVLLIPGFANGGRIGESFIFADAGAIRSTVLEDRAGIRADRASFALAHELGHVLLDEPGHPDDFGADTPTRLMDADSANASAFGPRRLLVDECVRALRQGGPGTPAALLAPWPLAPIGRER
jgi:hypothetical protein